MSEKAPRGLTQVLFVRCDRALLDALDELVAKVRTEAPGHYVSRADVARELLWRAVRAKGEG